jgi:outer membrane protein assembly factor BamB
LIGANASGPGRSIPLANSKSLTESNLRLIGGEGDTLWIGGAKNYRRSMFDSPVSDAYLAKLDREGHVVWESEIARNRENEIQDMASLSGGDVVIVGKENDTNWLARFSKEGRKSWEKTFGLGKIASVAVMDDTIVVAAFEANDGTTAQRVLAHVAMWRFSDAGELLDHHIIRDEIARGPHSSWLMKVVLRPNAIYVFSAWTESWAEPRSPKPLNVVKMDTQARVLWRKDIADTILQTRIGPSLCSLDVTVLASGSTLIGCGILGGTNFFRLDANTGESNQFFCRIDCDQTAMDHPGGPNS